MPKNAWSELPSPAEWVFDLTLAALSLTLWRYWFPGLDMWDLFLPLFMLFFVPWYAVALTAREPSAPWATALGGFLATAVGLAAVSISGRCVAVESGDKIEAFFIISGAILFIVALVNGFTARNRDREFAAGRKDGDGDMGLDQMLTALALGLLPMFFLFLHNPWQAYLDKRGGWGALTAVLFSGGIFLGGIAAVIATLGLMKAGRFLIQKSGMGRIFPWGGHLVFPFFLAWVTALVCLSPGWPLSAFVFWVPPWLHALVLMLFGGMLPLRLALAQKGRRLGWVTGALSLGTWAWVLIHKNFGH